MQQVLQQSKQESTLLEMNEGVKRGLKIAYIIAPIIIIIAYGIHLSEMS
jgi:hypothetical protein